MKLQEHHIRSSSGEYERKIWVLEAVGGPAKRLGVFLDGEFYVNKMDGGEALFDLQTRGVIPPTICVFVSHVSSEARHHDMTCNSRYAEFIAVDLVRWMRQEFGVPEESGHLIAGVSLSGLEAAYLALSYPQVFGQCLSQSGSFWWEAERLTGELDRMPASRGNFWLSVGAQETQSGLSHAPTGLRQEIAQVTACEHFAEALNERGHHVHFHLHGGTHSTEPWKAELHAALEWLLGDQRDP